MSVDYFMILPISQWYTRDNSGSSLMLNILKFGTLDNVHSMDKWFWIEHTYKVLTIYLTRKHSYNLTVFLSFQGVITNCNRGREGHD